MKNKFGTARKYKDDYNVRCIGCIHHISYKVGGEWIHECNLKNMSKITCDDFEMKDELSLELDAHRLMYQVLMGGVN